MKDSSSKQLKEVIITPGQKPRGKSVQPRNILDFNRQLINIIDFLPDATFVINLEGEVIAWNKAIEEMTGAPAKEVLGKNNYSALFYPVERPMLINLALNPDEAIESQYSNFKRKGGTLQAELFVKVAYGIGMAYLWGGATVLYDNDGNKMGAIESFRDLTGKKKYEMALRGAEGWFANMINFLPDAMFAIDKRGRVIAWNRAMEKMTGVRTDEIIGKGDHEYSIPFFGERRHMLIDLILNTDPALESVFHKLTKDNLIYTTENEANVSYREQKAYLWAQASPLYDNKGIIVGALESLRDITEIKQLEYSLRESERRLSDIIDFLPDATLVIDIEGRVIAWNQAAEDLTGVKAKDILGKGDNEYAIPFYGYKKPILIDLVLKGDDQLERNYPYLERKGKVLIGEFNCPAVKGGGAYLRATSSTLYDSSGNIVGAIEQIRDATNQKRTEEQMKYIGLHDALTGLYNRAYFEEEMNRLRHSRANSTVGMVMLDIDGLKQVNESFGHQAGDKLLQDTAKLVRSCFRPGDVIARTGGDEFTAILQNIDEKVLERAIERIRTKVEEFNGQDPAFPLSVSIGIAAGDEGNTDIFELFKKADNNMYREKLRRMQSNRSAIVQTLMKALETRDFITKGHAERLQTLAVALARKIGISEQRINDLVLLAQFHDIGKVGVADRILFKQGPLTPEERMEMQKHCEMGYHIALAAPDLAPIADWVLKHQEWWDGRGYPLELKGEEIPLECRIIAIVDAYDAMTSDRPYRKAMSHRNAVDELKRFSGTQFDPKLVDKFVKLFKKDNDSVIKM